MKYFFVGIIFMSLFIGIVLFIFFGSPNFVSLKDKPPAAADKTEPKVDVISQNDNKILAMKFINPDISDADLELLKSMGFSILSGEWGMDDVDVDETLRFLDRLSKHEMKYIVVLSDAAAWAPEWQTEKIQKYLNVLGSHSAIYGYDISNEAGENLGYGNDFRLTAKQISEAARTVREIDHEKPVIIRMHYWDEYDGDFTSANPFEKGIADIVMLNLYSNYSEDGATPLLPNMLQDSAETLVGKIKAVDRDVEVWISLGAFIEPPLFIEQSAEQLKKDIEVALELDSANGIGFFGWGPTEDNWYLPRDGKKLLNVIKIFSTVTN